MSHQEHAPQHHEEEQTTNEETSRELAGRAIRDHASNLSNEAQEAIDTIDDFLGEIGGELDEIDAEALVNSFVQRNGQ